MLATSTLTYSCLFLLFCRQKRSTVKRKEQEEGAVRALILGYVYEKLMSPRVPRVRVVKLVFVHFTAYVPRW